MTVRTPLTWLVVAALLPVIAFSAILVTIQVRKERTTIRERLAEEARGRSRAVDLKIESSITTLQALATSPSLNVPDLRAYRSLIDAVRRAAHPEWNAVGLLEPSGQLVLSTLVPPGTPLPSYADHPAFRELLAAQRPVVTNLGAGRLAGSPSVGIFVPVIRNRQLQYVMAAALSAETVSMFAGPATLPAGWSVRILDRQLVTVARIPPSPKAIGQAAHPGFLAQTRAAPDGWWRFENPEGEPLYTAYVRSPRFGWTTGLAVPAAVVEEPARRAFWTVGGGALVFLLLGTGLAWLTSRLITRPIAVLANGAARIGEGDTPGLSRTGLAELDAVGRVLESAVAERLRSEVSLRESEARLRTTLESIGDGVIATDAEGRVTYLNPVAEQLTGWTRAEATGQAITTVFSILNEETRRVAENPVHRVMAEGIVLGLANDTLLISRTGREIPIEDTGAPLKTPDGLIIGAVLVFQDAGAKRAAVAQFRIVADSAPVLVWMSGPDGGCTFVNKPWLEFTGRAMEQQLGTGWTEGVHREDLPSCLNAYETAFDARRPFTMEYRLRHRDGAYRWMLQQGVPRHEPDGAFAGYIGSCVDITERRQAEEIRRYLAAVVEGTDDAIVTKTLDGLITSWNPGAVRIFGYAPEEAVGRPITLIIPPERADEEKAVLARLRRGEGVDHFETVRVRKDGTRVDVSLTVSPIHGPDGRIIGASKIARDISAAKHLELERAELLEREQAARADAEAANRAKDDFLATLSHELRTPLSAILGWAQVISTGRRDEATLTQAIDSIERNARLQVKLIDDLLDLSRIVAGKVSLEPRTVDLGPVILAAIDTVGPTAKAKGVEVTAHVEAGTSLILGDPERLQQICWNLLSNAVKFTPRHGRVEIRLERTDSRAQIRVTDTGQGIAPDVLPHIFDRFRQGDARLSRAHGGLGLGLAIVRHLVELHGGTVHAESAGIGQGASFSLTFPLLPVRVADPAVQPLPSSDLRAGPRCDGLTVLAVDDEADARAVLARLLGLCGAAVTAVGSVPEALALLDARSFDVIVSDLALPGDDGFEFARQVRGRPVNQGGGTPLLALTAHAGTHMRIQAIQAGFDSYIAKPVDPGELAALVAQLANRHARTSPG